MKINLALPKVFENKEFLDKDHFHIKFDNGILIYLEISKSCFSFCKKNYFHMSERKNTDWSRFLITS